MRAVRVAARLGDGGRPEQHPGGRPRRQEPDTLPWRRPRERRRRDRRDGRPGEPSGPVAHPGRDQDHRDLTRDRRHPPADRRPDRPAAYA
ncbi:MAG: hypothetical protein ACRDP6_29620 [Actinoallomurus sp.]